VGVLDVMQDLAITEVQDALKTLAEEEHDDIDGDDTSSLGDEELSRNCGTAQRIPGRRTLSRPWIARRAASRILSIPLAHLTRSNIPERFIVGSTQAVLHLVQHRCETV
jgi:hypothetical protein